MHRHRRDRDLSDQHPSGDAQRRAHTSYSRDRPHELTRERGRRANAAHALPRRRALSRLCFLPGSAVCKAGCARTANPCTITLRFTINRALPTTVDTPLRPRRHVSPCPHSVSAAGAVTTSTLYVSMPMMAVVELVATGSVTAQCSGAVGALIPNELLIAELSAMQVESIH